MVVIKILLILFLGENAPLEVTLRLLFVLSLWKMFQKSGIKSWWALIPWAREYQLSRCAGREQEGRMWSISAFGLTVLELCAMYVSMEEMSAGTVVITLLTGMDLLVYIIYSLRVFSGVCELYNAKKRWLWLWCTTYLRWIPGLIFAFSKKYQPAWQVEDFREEMERLAFHGSAEVMDKGLTINLKERSVREFFQKKVLLRDIHMSIPQGHMVLLLGGSGAGKTTFLNAVNGYEKADAEVVLNGVNMYRQYKKMQYEVGFVPQQEMMRSKDTVQSTLFDAAKLRLPKEVPASMRRKRVEEVMEIFGLTPVKNNLVEKLSGGQKKRLSISMEFISNPSLFILDEPDSGLDGVMARELFLQLRKVADTGKIVIVITHTPDRVIDLFDDVIVLAKDSARTGRLAFYGSIGEARTFFGRESMEQIVKSVNRKEEGGDGLADDFVAKYAEVKYA